MKKTLRISIKISGNNVPDFGLGNGVVGYQDFIYDLPENEYSEPRFIHHINQKGRELLDDFIEIEFKFVEGNE